MRLSKSRLFFTLLMPVILMALLGASSITAQQALPRATEGAFVPVGAGYIDTYEGWIGNLISASTDTEIRIVVLTIAYGYDPYIITQQDRDDLTLQAQGRADEVQTVCVSLKTLDQTCVTVLAPIFIRDDALAATAADYFTGSVDAIFVLGGDQTIAMQVVANTPVETLMQQLQTNGTVLVGTSAGSAIQSKTMISGYVDPFGPESGLVENTVNVWNDFNQDQYDRGLIYGIDNAVIDQHFFQRTRLARLLNVLAQPDVTPKIGVGVDAYTGVYVKDRTTVGNTFGLYVAGILDAETYGSAANAQFINSILSIHDVLVHLIAPGTSSYDLTTKLVSLDGTPVAIPVYEPRSFDTLKLPADAGALILGGNLELSLTGSPVLAKLVELSGGASANILIVADGYADDPTAQAAADAYAAALGVPSTIVIVGDTPTAATGDYTGILLIGKDKSLITPASVSTVIGTRWQDGTPVLADNAMAAILGSWYTNHAPTDIGGENEELDVQGAFINGNTQVAAGLGWINASFEPTLLLDERLGRWFSLAYAHPDTLVVGITDDTALALTPERAEVLGTNGLMLLDARRATLALGTTNGYVMVNALIDTYAPGETLPVNLLTNAGFDGDLDASKQPVGWKAKGTSKKDKVKVDKPDDDLSVDGSKAYVFKGEVGENSKLVQKVFITGLVAGDNLQLSGYFRSKNGVSGLTIQLKVKYVDTSIPAGKITLEADPGTFAYVRAESSITTAGVPLLLKTRIRYKNSAATGKSYVDAVKILVNPTAPAAPAAQQLPLPAAPLSMPQAASSLSGR